MMCPKPELPRERDCRLETKSEIDLYKKTKVELIQGGHNYKYSSKSESNCFAFIENVLMQICLK